MAVDDTDKGHVDLFGDDDLEEQAASQAGSPKREPPAARSKPSTSSSKDPTSKAGKASSDDSSSDSSSDSDDSSSSSEDEEPKPSKAAKAAATPEGNDDESDDDSSSSSEEEEPKPSKAAKAAATPEGNDDESDDDVDSDAVDGGEEDEEDEDEEEEEEPAEAAKPPTDGRQSDRVDDVEEDVEEEAKASKEAKSAKGAKKGEKAAAALAADAATAAAAATSAAAETSEGAETSRAAATSAASADLTITFGEIEERISKWDTASLVDHFEQDHVERSTFAFDIQNLQESPSIPRAEKSKVLLSFIHEKKMELLRNDEEYHTLVKRQETLQMFLSMQRAAEADVRQKLVKAKENPDLYYPFLTPEGVVESFQALNAEQREAASNISRANDEMEANAARLESVADRQAHKLDVWSKSAMKAIDVVCGINLLDVVKHIGVEGGRATTPSSMRRSSSDRRSILDGGSSTDLVESEADGAEKDGAPAFMRYNVKQLASITLACAQESDNKALRTVQVCSLSLLFNPSYPLQPLMPTYGALCCFSSTG